MSVVIEDEDDRIVAPTRGRDTPVPDSPVAEPRESRAAPARGWRERLRLPLMIGVPLIAGVVALYFYLASVGYESTDDAYFAAQVSISPNVSGRVMEVNVHDNQLVRRGETLIRLDERPFRIVVEDARARVANARLQIESLKATYWQRMADLRAAQSTLEYQKRENERQAHLLASGISPQSLVERTLDARNQAQQNVISDQQQINATLASLGGDPNIPADRHPMVQEAQAQLDHALLNLSYTQMCGFSPLMDNRLVIWSGLIQGMGIGLAYVPLTTVCFATLAPQFRSGGTSMFNLLRNIGSSIGISVVQLLLTRNTQIMHSRLAEHITLYGGQLRAGPPYSFSTHQGLAALNASVTRQAQMIAYNNDFKLLLVLSLVILPLVLLLKPPRLGAGSAPVIME